MSAAPRRTVLVVEDERIVAIDLQQTLDAMGYDAVATASSAAEALRRVRERRPDVVVMDIRIKGSVDGIDAAAQLRREHDLPVIFLTAHADDATVARATQAEPYGYLLKPVKAAELRTAIEIALCRRDLERRLRDREQWFATTLRSITDAVVAVDLDGNVSFMNAAAEGLREEAALYRADGVTRLPSQELPIVRALAGETVEQHVMYVCPPDRPEGRWHSVNANPVRDQDGRIRGAVAVSRDITELRRAYDQLEQAAVRDDLTGLLNRRGFQEHAASAILLANRAARPLALVYLDLNGMKAINDGLGHQAGDYALVDAADLLRKTFRASDLIARLGGDEFVVLAPEYTEADAGGVIRARFDHHLTAFNATSGRPYRLSASLGISIYDPRGHHRTIEDLLADADAAMYAAKARRRLEGSQRVERIP